MRTVILFTFFLNMVTFFMAQIESPDYKMVNSASEQFITLKTERLILLKSKAEKGRFFFISDSDKIKVITKDGFIHSGFFEFIDDKSILLDGESIQLSRIDKIKRPKKVLRIFGGIVGTLSSIILPLSTGGGDPSVLIFEPFYASPLYLTGIFKTFDLTKKFDLFILKSNH